MNFFSQKNRILLKELIKTDFKLSLSRFFHWLSLVYFETFDDVYNHVPCLCSFLEI